MQSLIPQLTCILLFLSLIANSTQLPKLDEEVKRTSHKLMRFGRTSAHNMMHFGKRGNSQEINEDVEPLKSDENVMDDEMLLYSLLNRNYWPRVRKSNEKAGDLLGAARRAQMTPLPSYMYASPSAYLRSNLPLYYDKKADNRDNVFMHFG